MDARQPNDGSKAAKLAVTMTRKWQRSISPSTEQQDRQKRLDRVM
jgi:hypothetical protein